MKLFSEKSKDEFLTAIKKALPIETSDDNGTFKVVVSTDDLDRQGESVNQQGWDFTNYMNNPVVLWAHNYSEPPIGKCTKIETVGNKTVAEGVFAPTDFAQQIRKLYEGGYLSSVSAGFITKEQTGSQIDSAEFLEFSFCPVPANPYALTTDSIKKYNLDLAMLKTKGIEYTIKDEGQTPVVPTEPVNAPENVPTDKPDEVVVPPVEVEQTPEFADETTVTPEPVKPIGEVIPEAQPTADTSVETPATEPEVETKSGRAISKATKDIIAECQKIHADAMAQHLEALKACKKAIDAHKELDAKLDALLSIGNSESDGGEQDGASPAQNTKVEKSSVSAVKTNEFLAGWEALKIAEKAVTEGLTLYKSAARQHRQS